MPKGPYYNCDHCFDTDASGRFKRHLFHLRMKDNGIIGFQVLVDDCKIVQGMWDDNLKVYIPDPKDTGRWVVALDTEPISIDPFDLNAIRALIKTALVWQ